MKMNNKKTCPSDSDVRNKKGRTESRVAFELGRRQTPVSQKSTDLLSLVLLIYGSLQYLRDLEGPNRQVVTPEALTLY